MKKILAGLFLFLGMAAALAPGVKAKIYIDINSPYLKKVPIGVPYPIPVPNTFEGRILARQLATTLGADLEFHGLFKVETPDRYGTGDLSGLDVDFVVDGNVFMRGKRLTVELKLLDRSDGRMITGRRYRGGVNDQRIIAHRFCNEIVKAITGEEGLTLSTIVFIGETKGEKEVYAADFDGRNVRRITFERSIVVSPRLSPGGRYLVYTSYRTGRPYLYLKDLKADKVYRLSRRAGLNISPAWHPDGRLIAVTLSQGGNPDIYLMNLSGKVVRRLTRGRGINVSPSFSPDGKEMAFVSDRGGSPQVYVMELATGEVRRITWEGGYNTSPRWSPRGDRIAYAGRVNGQMQIFTVDPQGREPVQLTFFGENENPTWSPDGRLIAFDSTRLGSHKSIYVMFANGRSQRRLVRFSSGASMPYWGKGVE